MSIEIDLFMSLVASALIIFGVWVLGMYGYLGQKDREAKRIAKRLQDVENWISDVKKYADDKEGVTKEKVGEVDQQDQKETWEVVGEMRKWVS